MLAIHKELSVTQLAKILKKNTTESHRFLSTMKELNYVEKNSKNRYQLTFKIFELGMLVAERFEIIREARPYIEKLAQEFNETVNLGYRDGLEVLHLDKVSSIEILRMDSPVGSRAPAYCASFREGMLSIPSDERFK